MTGEAHAAEACALPFTAGRGRPRPAGYLPTYDRMTLSDRGVLENARRPAVLRADIGSVLVKALALQTRAFCAFRAELVRMRAAAGRPG